MGMAFPTLARELAANEDYRRYLYAIPSLDYRSPAPWRVTTLGFDNLWTYQDYANYSDALQRYYEMYTTNAVIDVALISRTKLFKMPAILFDTVKRGQLWCPACRRPSTFGRETDHHADHLGLFKLSPATRRCFYCGTRREIADEYQ